MEASERTPLDAITEEIARSFHIAYEKFAPDHGWETNRQSRGIWEEVPEQNRALMIAVVKKLLIDDVIEPGKALTASIE